MQQLLNATGIVSDGYDNLARCPGIFSFPLSVSDLPTALFLFPSNTKVRVGFVLSFNVVPFKNLLEESAQQLSL